MKRRIAAASLVIAWTSVATAYDLDDIPARVALTILSHDDRPVAARPVEIRSLEDPGPPPGLAHHTALTDAAGTVRFPWRSGRDRLLIEVHGVGFATTSPNEFLNDADVTLPKLRLVPFAEIEGVVPAELRGEVTEVALTGTSFRRRPPRRLDADGRFKFDDAAPGNHVVHLRHGGEVRALGRISVVPGERAEIRSFERATRYWQPDVVAPPDALPEQAVWARGTVRDSDGRPLAGVVVRAIATAYDGIRGVTLQASAQTDTNGRWELVGSHPRRYMSFEAVLAYGRPGEAHGVCTMRFSADGGPMDHDLVPPSSSGALRVRVLYEGAPCADAVVGVRRTSSPTSNHADIGDLLAGFGGTDSLTPTVMTGADGSALLAGLAPGRYDIAVATDPTSLFAVRRFQPDSSAQAVRKGIAVHAEKTTDFSVNLFELTDNAEFSLHARDGSAVPAPIGITAERVDREYLRLPHRPVETLLRQPRGWRFSDVGLWRIRAYPIGGPPTSVSSKNLHAPAITAVSPLLIGLDALKLTSLDEAEPPFTVLLLDAEDRPCRGTVVLNPEGALPKFAAATDEYGIVSFAAVDRSYLSVATFAAEDQFRRPRLADRPTDDQLVGLRRRLLKSPRHLADPSAPFIVRPEPVGYARGRIVPAYPKTPADYRITISYGGACSGHELLYDHLTGEFLAGPFSVGRANFFATMRGDDDRWRNLPSIRIPVRADRVVSAVLTCRARDPSRPGIWAEDVTLRVDDDEYSVSQQEPLRGVVYESDGRTPAAGASIGVYRVGVPNCRYFAPTDGLGRFASDRAWLYPMADAQVMPLSDVRMFALLPGACGPTILSGTALNQTRNRLVLPKPQSVVGRVLVAGRAAGDCKCLLRVLAASAHAEHPGSPFDVSADASADGTFELGGLVPGRYRVQASLDGIWLSPAIELVVREGGDPLSPITLDIPHPGLPSEIRCVDTANGPVVGAKLAVRRPAGPLAEQLWPTEFASDGAGVVHMPPLEAGEHVITSLADSREHRITIPPLAIPPHSAPTPHIPLKRPRFQITIDPTRAEDKAR